MKAVSKKLLSLLLVAILLVAAVPFQALAAEVEEPAPAAPATYTLTLDANGGNIGVGTKLSRDVTVGQTYGTLTTPSRDGYTFLGWYTDPVGGTLVEEGTTYTTEADSTIYAHWELIAKGVVIKAVLDGDKAGAYDLHKETLGVNEFLLDYLDSVKSEIASMVPAGYTWDTHWYDFSSDALIDQNENFSNWRTVYVKFTAKNNLKLYFNVGDGAVVSPTQKTVTYNQKVGTLPTPTRNGYVFRGWYTGENGTGTLYTSETVYLIDGDTTLYANWKKQATVILEIYVNGDTSEPDRCPVLTGYAVGDNVTRASVSEIIKKYYSAVSGSSLTVQGLYAANAWQDYLEDSSTSGIASIEIHTDSEPIHIYVMVNNAKQGGTTSTTTPTTGTTGNTGNTDSTKPADPTNPATGDTSMIYGSMTVMLIAVAALVVVMQLRKRRMV